MKRARWRRNRGHAGHRKNAPDDELPPPPKSELGRFWQRYKDETRYQKSPFPFPQKRMNLFDKLSSDFSGLLMLVGGVWLVFLLIGYALT